MADTAIAASQALSGERRGLRAVTSFLGPAFIAAVAYVPVFARRAVTMVPALVVLALGFRPTRALVLSQVFLSFGIPFALIPLVSFTANRDVMGGLVNRRLTSIAAVTVTAVIVSLNVYLLVTA